MSIQQWKGMHNQQTSSDCFHFIFDSRVFFSLLFQSSHFHRIVAVFSLIHSVCVQNKCMCKFVGVFLFGFWLLQAIIVLSEVARIRISGARPIDFKHISALVMKSNFFFRLAKSQLFEPMGKIVKCINMRRFKDFLPFFRSLSRIAVLLACVLICIQEYNSDTKQQPASQQKRCKKCY